MKSETINIIIDDYKLDGSSVLSSKKNCFTYKKRKQDENFVDIYDFSELKSNDDIDELIFSYDNSGNNICIFKDSEQENQIRDRNIDFFENSFFTYYDENEPIHLKVTGHEGNYLDYNDKHYIFNMSIKEILELYKKVGYRIYDFNVRSYLKSKRSTLKTRFIEYLYNFLKLKNVDETILNNEYFSDVDKNSCYENSVFWGCHNGITICTNKLNLKFKELTFEPARTYILNGAQTVSSFSEIYDEVSKIIDSELVENFFNSVIVKTIILIEDKPEAITMYSIGLNTQQPINNYTILAAGEEASKINCGLKNFSIVRDGDSSNKNKLDVLSFVKCCLIIDQLPEHAKNYTSKNKIIPDFKKFYNIYKTNFDELNSKLLICKNAASTFKSVSSEIEYIKMTENEKAIYSYGINYFQSYCVKNNISESSKKDVDQFISIINAYCDDNKVDEKSMTLNINTFKTVKNSLYKLIFNNEKK